MIDGNAEAMDNVVELRGEGAGYVLQRETRPTEEILWQGLKALVLRHRLYTAMSDREVYGPIREILGEEGLTDNEAAILAAVYVANGSRTTAAQLVGMSFSYVCNQLQHLRDRGIDVPQGRSKPNGRRKSTKGDVCR